MIDPREDDVTPSEPYDPNIGVFQLMVRARYSYGLAGEEPADVAAHLQGIFEEVPGVLMDVLHGAYVEGDLEVAVIPARNASTEDLDDVLLRERTDAPDLVIPDTF